MDVHELRAIVRNRSNGWCEACGGSVGFLWALHHRQLRSQGGADSPENALCLHHECHNGSTESVHNHPERSRERGYIVSAYADPATVPVLLYGERGWWVRLNADGTYTKIEEERDGADHG